MSSAARGACCDREDVVLDVGSPKRLELPAVEHDESLPAGRGAAASARLVWGSTLGLACNPGDLAL
jgi:hypothetical protein